MDRIIILSTDVYTDLEQDEQIEFKRKMDELVGEGNTIVFTSRNAFKKNQLKDIDFNKGIYFKTRSEVETIIKKYTGKYFIMVGNKDLDLRMAANNKILFLVPKWCNTIEELPIKYGLKITNINQFKKVIDVIVNQDSWFYRLDLDEKTTILSLTNANNYGASNEENEMINGFRAYLKEGNKQYYRVLLYHFLAAISNNEEFREVKDWGIFPSSGTDQNNDLFEFKEKARELMNGKKKESILVRHTATWKSHDSKKHGKNRLPADRHFDTIVIGDRYKGKLKGRVVCIFDDYLTNGTSFESARNILLHEGVAKMFFVSLGKFHKNNSLQYFRQEFTINGDVSKANYNYQCNCSKWFNGEFNYDAIKEIEKLHKMIFG